jgi:hypothetical protein
MARAIEGHALGLDVGLEHRDKRRFVLVDGDGLGEGVLEEVIKLGGVGAVGDVLYSAADEVAHVLIEPLLVCGAN